MRDSDEATAKLIELVMSAIGNTTDTAALATQLLDAGSDHSAILRFAAAHGTQAVDTVLTGKPPVAEPLPELMRVAAALAFTEGVGYGMEYSRRLTALARLTAK